MEEERVEGRREKQQRMWAPPVIFTWLRDVDKVGRKEGRKEGDRRREQEKKHNLSKPIFNLPYQVVKVVRQGWTMALNELISERRFERTKAEGFMYVAEGRRKEGGKREGEREFA